MRQTGRSKGLSRSTPEGDFPVQITGSSILFQAVMDGDLAIIKRKLKPNIFKKAEDVNQRDDRQCTALHYAAKRSCVKIATLLLDKGADITAVDKHGWGVLHYSVRYGSENMVEFLISRGADLHLKEKRGWNILHLACRNGQAQKGRMLLEYGVNIDSLQNQGWNALHLAVRYGQPDTISTLLEHGIDINASNNGWTALHLAALNGHMDIVSILLNKGGDCTKGNRSGKTPLDIAREEGHEKIVAIIIETEFQLAEPPPLPSPPPTPHPSAPPIEFFGDVGSWGNTFDEWKIKLRQDLEDLSMDDNSDESMEINEETEEQKEKDDGDHFMKWKSFEEEKCELLQQLERVRLKEVNRLADEKIKKKDKHISSMARIDKQSELIKLQIENLRSSIPSTQQSGMIKYQTLKEDITQISVLIENSMAEMEIIESLKSHHIDNDFCELTKQKWQLIEQLAEIQLLEKEELLSKKREKYGDIEQSEVISEKKIQNTVKKIKVLEEELEKFAGEKLKKEKSYLEEMMDIEASLEKAERQRVIAQKDEDEERFACPVCIELLKPPVRIFQCPEGHILCEDCKENPALVHCPQCRVPLERNCSRNRALEEMARSFFPQPTVSSS